MKTLTFLIPCYNVASFVSRCIDSMIVMEILDDIEILLINDGSKDNTLEVLNSYAAKYPNIIRIIDKENGGWGTAINTGIHEAKGKYIKEVDADDWVESINLPQYIEFLKQNDIDYIATEYSEFICKENKVQRHTFDKEIYDTPMSINDFWERHSSAWDFPIHAITYRTQLLRNNNISVGERYYGDIEYNLYPLPHVQTICILPINVTVYFRGSDEQSTSTKGYAKHYKDYAAMSQRITKFKNTLSSTIHSNLLVFINNTVRGTILKAYNLMMSPIYAGNTEGVKKELQKYDHWLKETDKELYKYCGRQRKHGIAYIRIWRWFKINLLSYSISANDT